MNSRNGKPSGCAFMQYSEPRRGGTAPGPVDRASSFGYRPPNSSHKYMIKGKGWNSGAMGVRQPVRARLQKETSMPQSIKSKLIPVEDEEAETIAGPSVDGRPISRHKSPPKSVGLDLPPCPGTPPESVETNEMFEQTWSHFNTAQPQTDQREQPIPNRRQVQGQRPITVNPWESESGGTVIGKSRVATAKTYNQRQSGNSGTSNRIYSASRANRSGKTRPVPQSAKSSTGHLKSNLEPEFLNLFDNRLPLNYNYK